MIKLPDFEVLYETVNSISEFTTKSILAKAEYEYQFALVCKEGMEVTEGRPPSMDYLKTSVAPLDERVRQAKRDLADVEGKLENYKNLFKVLMAQVDVYRTESANQRTLPV